MNAIKNEFETIGDQVNRLKGIWKGFLSSVVGKPNDPSSLYGQTTAALKAVADGVARHWKNIKRAAYMIGQTLGWVIRQIGHFVVWLGRKMSNAIGSVWKITDAYQEQTRSLIVWLEFWKLKILDFLRDLWAKTSKFFHTYKDEIKTVAKIALAYMVLTKAFTIGKAAIDSVMALRAAWLLNIATVKRYRSIVLLANGADLSKAAVRYSTFAAFLPKTFRKPLLAIGRMADRYIIPPLNKSFAKLQNHLGKIRKAAPFVAKSIRLDFKRAMDIWRWPLAIEDSLKAMFKGFKKGIGGTVSMSKNLVKGLVSGAKSFAKILTDNVVKGAKLTLNIFKNLPQIIMAAGKGLAAFGVSLLKGSLMFVKGIGKGIGILLKAIINLPFLIKAAANSIKIIMQVLMGSNPIGWIMLAITLLVVLYNKSKTFRVFINNLFKWIWEALKFVYNLIVGAIVYTIVGIKRVWKWFKTHIWDPIAGFFKKVYTWIGEMWKKFKNSTVGKWIDDHIIQPFRDVFDWVVKAWKWVLTAIGKAVSILSGANSDLAKNINELAKAEGLDALGVAVSGGDYDTNDDTNYLSEMFGGGDKEPSAPDS